MTRWIKIGLSVALVFLYVSSQAAQPPQAPLGNRSGPASLSAPLDSHAGPASLSAPLGSLTGPITLATSSPDTVRLPFNPPSGRIAIVFLSPECPLCQNYTRVLNELTARYRDSCTIYGVIPGKAYSASEIKEFEKTYKIIFPVLTDREFKLAHNLKASITPEVFLLESASAKSALSMSSRSGPSSAVSMSSRSGSSSASTKPSRSPSSSAANHSSTRQFIVLYSGLIDNWAASLGVQRKVVTEHYLADAIAASMQHQPITVSHTQAVGCFINNQ